MIAGTKFQFSGMGEMATDKWLTTIGAAAQTLFWAIGYFIGFTFVTMISIGVLIPAGFEEIGRDRRPWWCLVWRREGKFYVGAECVAAIGWFLLSAMNLAFLFA